MRDYWEQQSEQEVAMLPVDTTLEVPANTGNEEITVVLDEKETRTLLKEISSTHRVQINEVLLTALVQATTKMDRSSDADRGFGGAWSGRDYRRR